MTNLKKWKESDIKLSKSELKERFGIDEDRPGMLLEDEMELVIAEIRTWSPEAKAAAREYLMTELKRPSVTALLRMPCSGRAN